MGVDDNIKNFLFLLESYGSNKLVKKLKNHIKTILNGVTGRLIRDGKITLKNSLERFRDIPFFNDTIHIKLSNRTYGNVNVESIRTKGGVITNMVVNLEIRLSLQEIYNRKIDPANKIFGTISHEFLRVVEMYLTHSNTDILSRSWEYGKRLQILVMAHKQSVVWQEVSHMIYRSLPHEIRSRVEGIHAEIDGVSVRGVARVTSWIKTTGDYLELKSISKIDPQKMLDRMRTDVDYVQIMTEFNRDFLCNEKTSLIDCEREFLNYVVHMKRRCGMALNKMCRTAYLYERRTFRDTVLEDDFMLEYPRDYEIDFRPYI